MSIRVYNTLTKEKEVFRPVNPGQVGIYLCGPTVYKPPHIGHMVGPVIFDAIKRYLTSQGFKVTWVVNITDVDDKLIEAAHKHNTTVEALASRYTAEYMQCLAMFGIDTIDRFPKASEHMREIIDLCQQLIARGFAYPADGNVWFDVTRDPDYGKLSHRKVEEQESGLRTLEGAGKRNPADFALWKAAKSGEPSWDSPWGNGRPGWHIECSAMSMKYLGQTLDMHGGGMDLLFPHHENELAQSESVTGKPFVHYWMHNGLTRIKTKLSGAEREKMEKMSGSLGNVVSAQQLIEQYGPDMLRYFLLSTHYRSPIEFTDEALANSKKAYAVFTRLFERLERLTGQPVPPMNPEQATGGMEGDFIQRVAAHRTKFMEMMDDDFNTAGAIGVMHELAGEINAFIEQNQLERDKQSPQVRLAAAATAALKGLGLLIGLFRAAAVKIESRDSGLVDKLMALLIQLRQEARKTKNFAIADAVRKGLGDLGITLEDRPDGTIWRKD